MAMAKCNDNSNEVKTVVMVTIRDMLTAVIKVIYFNGNCDKNSSSNRTRKQFMAQVMSIVLIMIQVAAMARAVIMFMVVATDIRKHLESCEMWFL